MLIVNKHKQVLLDSFYLDSDNITIRRKQNGYRGKYMKHDIVVPYKLCSFGYGGIHIPRTRTSVSLTHLLLLLRGVEIPDGSVVDHINGDSNDNSPDNLRITTQVINCRNQRKRKNNTTGITGVSWNAKAKGYNVRCGMNGKRVYLGLARTLDEAQKMLDQVTDKILESGYTRRHGK